MKSAAGTLGNSPFSPASKADERDYNKVEKWTKDDSRVARMLYAGNNLDSVVCD